MAVATSQRRASARRAAAHFVQAAFSVLQAHVAAGHEVPFALEEARRDGRPALYDYRPLFRSYVTQRVDELTRLADFGVATEALAADPVLLAVAREQAGTADEATALRDAVLVPLVVGVAEGCGGFDFDEGVFDALYARLEGAVAGARRAYSAFTPLVGVRGAPDAVDLGGGVVLRRTDASTLAERWPECQALLPDRFGVDPDRQHGLELDLALDRASDQAPPDAVAAFVRAVVALRLVTGGAVTAGPIVFERVDWSPRAVRAVPALASTSAPGEPARLDANAVPLVRALVARLGAERGLGGAAVSVALARYGGAASAADAGERVAGLTAVLEPLLGDDGAGSWAVSMRAAALVASTAAERRRIAVALRDAIALGRLRGGPYSGDLERLARTLDDVARSVLVAALELDCGPSGLADLLDEVLLGARPRPQVVGTVARSA
jgi:hypothetical protein